MQRQEKNEIYSIRKFKIGVGSTLIGLSFLGATGALGHVSVVKDVVGVQSVYAAEATPQPEGNVVARGEDGVPWELYENGYLLFKPVAGKDTLRYSVHNVSLASWKALYANKIKTVGFAGKVYAPENSSYLFSTLTPQIHDSGFNPYFIDTKNLDTSKVTDMSHMFQQLSNIENLDVTHFDTSNVTDMRSMFKNMRILTDLDVTHFVTKNVTNMSEMFNGLSKLKKIEVSKFDTSKVKDMGSMFAGMSNLTNLDISDWDTSEVTNMSLMFSGASGLTSLDLNHWDTSKVKSMAWMFNDASSLTSLNIGDWDTSNVTNMYSMFSRMNKMKELDLGRWDTSKVTNMVGIFDMIELRTLNIKNWDVSNVSNLDYLFNATQKLENITLGDKFKSRAIQTIDGRYRLFPTSYPYKWHKVNDPSNAKTVSEWATSYESDPTSNAGTWVREVAVQDATLEFEPGNGERIQPLTFRASSTPTPPTPTVDKAGYKFKGWTLQDGSEVNLSSLPAGSRTTLVGKWEKVNNVNTRTVKIPVTTVYEGDSNLDKGKQTEVPGQEGEKRITTTFTVTPITGKLTNPVEKEEITQAMRPKVIKLGTKDKVETKVIPSPKRYESDTTKDFGTPNVETKGKDGSDVVTTVYTVNPKDGTISEKSTKQHTDATPTIVKVGTKPKVVTRTDDQGRKVTDTTTYTVDPNTGKVTPSTTTSYGDKAPTVDKKVVPSPKRYEKDSTRDKGAENIVVKGKDGEDQITTTYSVDQKTGNVVPTVGKPVRTIEPTDTLIKVAAKDKVETIRKNGDTFERTTMYTVNPKTGEITEEVTEKLIASNGLGIKPPVVENNDFNGGVNGEPLVNEKEDYKGVLSGNGLDGNGRIIEPPIFKLPEFTGGVNGNLDGNPLINEKPEFDLSTLKTPDLGTGLNDFGLKKDVKKDDLQFIPVNEEKPSNDFKRSEKPVSEKPVNQLPNTAGGDNAALNALGALTLASVLGLATTKLKKEK